MYSFKVESQDEHKPVIERSMSSNSAIELKPVLVAICKAEFGMVDPIALYMGDNVYRIFDIDKPHKYAEVSIIKDTN